MQRAHCRLFRSRRAEKAGPLPWLPWLLPCLAPHGRQCAKTRNHNHDCSFVQFEPYQVSCCDILERVLDVLGGGGGVRGVRDVRGVLCMLRYEQLPELGWSTCSHRARRTHSESEPQHGPPLTHPHQHTTLSLSLSLSLFCVFLSPSTVAPPLLLLSSLHFGSLGCGITSRTS